MKTKKIILSTLLFSCLSSTCLAENLVDIFKLAYANDPQYKAANAQWLANKENLPIAVAGLLPQVNAVGNVARNLIDYEAFIVEEGSVNNRFFSNTASYSITLTQPIFNFGNWATVWGAQAIVKQAEATYLSAYENLLLRTSQAYFSVLQAQDILRFTVANKEAVKRQLEQTQHRYDVGLIAITDLENTKASYDQATADEIVARKNLSDTIEQLAAITGKKSCSLDTIKVNFPLITPMPNDSDRWVKAAEMQNFDLAAATFNSEFARQNIKVKFAGHLPVLNGGLSYNYSYDNNNTGFHDFSREKTSTASLGLSVPIFQGGAVTAQTQQAEYLYQQALSLQEQSHRSVVSQTRQAYLAVLAGISKVTADKQLVKSTESSLRSTEAGYSVGTRTMVDVLKATSDYYNAQKALAIDEYDFINKTLLLKSLAGVLNVDDLQCINTWLIPPQSPQCRDAGLPVMKKTAKSVHVKKVTKCKLKASHKVKAKKHPKHKKCN